MWAPPSCASLHEPPRAQSDHELLAASVAASNLTSSYGMDQHSHRVLQLRLQDRNPLHPTPAPSAGTPDSAFLDLASMSPFSMRTDAKVCATPANHLMQPQHSPVFATPKGIATRDPELPARRQLYRDRPTCDCACICMVISGLCIVVLLCIGMQANGMLKCPT